MSRGGNSSSSSAILRKLRSGRGTRRTPAASVGTELTQRGEPRGLLRPEQALHQCAADDHTVGEGTHLGRLVAVAHAQTDPDR